MIKKAFVVIVAGVAVLAGTYGCGGSSGVTQPEGERLIIDFNNNVTAPVLDADRAAAESTVEAAWLKNGSLPLSQQTKALADTMKTLKAFRSSGYSADGEVWGVYTDGIAESFVLNDPFQKSTAGLRPQLAQSPIAKPGDEISGSSEAYVFNALEASRGFPVGVLVSDLTNAGYKVISSGGSLADWSAVSNASVLVVGSHGDLMLDRAGNTVYYQETSDVVSPALDSQYSAMLSSQAIQRMTVPEYDALGNVKFVTHYGMCGAFLAGNKGMFSANSLMYNAACKGLIDIGYGNSLITKNGLSIYLGWSQSTGDQDSGESAVFMLDRLLGLNKYPPVDPLLPPPATLNDVLFAMQSSLRNSGGGYSYTVSRVQSSTGGIVVAKLRQLAGQSDLGTIVPSIESLTNTNGNLVLTGHFGSVAGVLQLSGAGLSTTKWSSSEIDAALGANSNGGVLQAISHGLLSNTVNLSTVSVTPSNAQIAPGATLTLTASISPNYVLPKNSTIVYDWSQTGGAQSILSDGSGVSGQTSIQTNSAKISLITTPSQQANIVVKVIAFAKSSTGVKSQIGQATCSVSVVGGIHGTVTVQITSVSWSVNFGAEGTRYCFACFYALNPNVPGATSYVLNANMGSGQTITTAELAKGAPLVQGNTTYPIPNSFTYPGSGFCNLGGGLVGFPAYEGYGPDAANQQLQIQECEAAMNPNATFTVN